MSSGHVASIVRYIHVNVYIVNMYTCTLVALLSRKPQEDKLMATPPPPAPLLALRRLGTVFFMEIQTSLIGRSVSWLIGSRPPLTPLIVSLFQPICGQNLGWNCYAQILYNICAFMFLNICLVFVLSRMKFNLRLDLDLYQRLALVIIVVIIFSSLKSLWWSVKFKLID